MAFLLDTHALLWFLEESPRLSVTAREITTQSDAAVYVSIVSAWEIALKMSVGKLTLRMPLSELFRDYLNAETFALLPIGPDHLCRFVELPRHHGDPFDRLITAQALNEDFTLVSCDAAFDAYGVRRLW